MRGMLTEEIEKISEDNLGYKISRKELRLMPYIQNLLMNSKVLDSRRIDDEEREIIKKWEAEGHIIIGYKMFCSKHFWDAMSEILWCGYGRLNEK